MGERDDVLQQYRDAFLGVANSLDSSPISLTPTQPTTGFVSPEAVKFSFGATAQTLSYAANLQNRAERFGYLDFSLYLLFLTNESPKLT